MRFIPARFLHQLDGLSFSPSTQAFVKVARQMLDKIRDGSMDLEDEVRSPFVPSLSAGMALLLEQWRQTRPRQSDSDTDDQSCQSDAEAKSNLL